MRVAALDLGTNTFLCLIAEAAGGRVQTIIRDETRLVRLGQDVNRTRRFHADALARADKCLSEYAEMIAQNRVTKVLAVATSAARDVENGSELLKICERLKIPVEIISGDREATLTFAGATSEFKDSHGVAVIDVGGGSTEMIVRAPSGELLFQSVNVGSVRMTEKFIVQRPAPQSDIAEMNKFIRDQLESARLPANGIMQVVAVAGTPTTLAALAQQVPFSVENVDGFVLSLDQLEAWAQRFANMTVSEIVSQYGIEEMRADVILAGTTVLKCALERLRQKELTVSVRGVRYGLAAELGK